MSGLYQSEKWLRYQYLTKKKKPEVIAAEAGVSSMTIYRYLEKFGLLRSKRGNKKRN